MSHRVETCVFDSGERFPLLIDSRTGMPDFYPALYAAVELRRNLVPNSIIGCLRAIRVMYLVGRRLGIDFEARMLSGQLLSTGEVEMLSAEVRKKVVALKIEVDDSEVEFLHALPHQQVAKIRKSLTWTRSAKTVPEVQGGFGSSRLLFIRDYLYWLSEFPLTRLTQGSPQYISLKQDREDMRKAITKRADDPWGKKQRNRRTSLPDSAREVLLNAIDPTSDLNPWSKPHAKMRNCLIVSLYINTGLRRGELGGLERGDIDYRFGVLRVVRRHDDPTDPRRDKPVAKTREREVGLSEGLLEMASLYVDRFRNKIPGARKHPYLLVDEHLGHPLSLSALSRIFQDLQECHPALTGLTAHVLRHTFNLDLSRESEKQGWTQEEEDRIRVELNGWANGSKMVTHYNQRFIADKARKAALGIQDGMPMLNGISRRGGRQDGEGYT